MGNGKLSDSGSPYLHSPVFTPFYVHRRHSIRCIFCPCKSVPSFPEGKAEPAEVSRLLPSPPSGSSLALIIDQQGKFTQPVLQAWDGFSEWALRSAAASEHQCSVPASQPASQTSKESLPQPVTPFLPAGQPRLLGQVKVGRICPQLQGLIQVQVQGGRQPGGRPHVSHAVAGRLRVVPSCLKRPALDTNPTRAVVEPRTRSGLDQPQAAPYSAENDARGDALGWQRTPPSTSPPGETPRPPSNGESKGSLALSAKKKRVSKPAHMRRNIRQVPALARHTVGMSGKLLREHQLEAVTKAAQQEELERRKRLEQQRKDFPAPPADFIQGEEVLRTGEVSQSTCHVAKQEVICLDTSNSSSSSSSSASEDDTKGAFRATKDDVIELSSGEDDALQISSESATEEEDRSATPGSEESSGAHVNDALNQPDAQGRVLVNINHPSTERDLFLAPQLARAVKPHQIGGIRFLYDNLVESLERYKTSSGFGCILAHSMGLGKTLQVISFIDVLLRHTSAHTVLAIVPVNTLQNWMAEFNLWLPAPESLPPDTDPSEHLPRTFKVHILNDEHKTTAARAKVISDWSTDGGVLLMGYEMYRLLSLKKSFVSGRRKKSKKPTGPVIIDLDEEDRQQELLKGIEKALSRPGPDVVICDEGHRIKNCHASTSQALKSIRSRRRVVLTGYPLQNNLIEYWCMVDFVRPDFLGTRQEFSNMFERPILNGQCIDSTPQDVRLMRYRSHVLHSLLEGFVQRRGHDVLKTHLPSKEEHVILVRLSPLQRALYSEFMNRFREAGNSGWLGLNPLKAFCVCCKIWNHPDVLYEALQKETLANEQDLDLDDITTGNSRCQAPAGLKPKLEGSARPDSTNSKYGLPGVGLSVLQEKANQVITYEWAKDLMTNYQTGVLENSAKMVLLFNLIDESVRKGDKILVFSQSLSTLSVIEEFLAKRPMPAEGHSGNWIRNVHYYRLDGSTSASERERLINQFNDPKNNTTWLFLLSTRAGCLGVNLIGANRVVVFDASWNPCHDAQAVCRVYRYGQRKPCHIYRLVCDFTLERKIYDRQISKQGMSDRVVDDLNPVLNFTRREVESLLHFMEEEPDLSRVHLEPSHSMESVIQQACVLYPHLITKQPFQHESLLMDRKEMKLTKAEKKAAKKSYEDEKRASVPYTRPSYAHYYPASDQSLTNIPAFSQRNWRPPPRPDEKPVASVRPVQSTPIPMMPRQVPLGPGSSMAGSSSGHNFPVNYLQRAGVFVQKIVTTTDIVIPGTNSTTDVQARISAGEGIHVIRGTKGTYIRTSDGRIFAIRAAGKAKPGAEGADASAGEPCSRKRAGPTPANNSRTEPSTALLRPLGSPPSADGGGGGAALDLRGTKRKMPTPSSEDPPHKQPPSKRTSVPLPLPGYPFPGAYSLPALGLNPALLGPMGHPMLMGAGSPYFQTPGQLGDSRLMFPVTPDPFGLGSGLPNSSSSASSSSGTSSSCSSAAAAGSASTSASLPPFMLNPAMAGMLPGFALPYGQSLLPEPRMYSNPLVPGGLPGAHGPGGSSFPPYFSAPGMLGAALRPPEPHELSESGASSSDDDVIEVTGQ
ncbi:ARIP4 Helicase, partial [Atractosteus spatula]|nr:ARIP4 Helicase [Atractosteus spatula]